MPAPFNLDRATFLQEVLQPARLTRIADVGGNPIDPAPYAKLLQAGLCEVWGFEPQQEAYAALVADAPPGANYLLVPKSAKKKPAAKAGKTSTRTPSRKTARA